MCSALLRLRADTVMKMPDRGLESAGFGISEDKLVNAYAEKTAQTVEVVDRRQSLAVEPAVNCLRAGKSQYLLQLVHAYAAAVHKPAKLKTGSGRVNYRTIQILPPFVLRFIRN